MTMKTEECPQNAATKQSDMLLRSASDALDWFQQHPEAIRSDPNIPLAALRRYRRQARRLYSSSTRPQSVAVFGASQAGKSYLVSGLAARPQAPLLACYGKQTLNFLTDMNPEGGNESTGLVSRFSVKKTPGATEEFCVPLRFLTAGDVIKILVNTSLEDFRVAAPATPPDVENFFANIPEGSAQDSPLDIDTLEDIRDYLEAYFPDNPHLDTLGAAYWAHILYHAPGKTARTCAQLCAPLWRNIRQFTHIAEKLLSALTLLNCSETGFCRTDSLAPRHKSILNVETLFDLDQTADDTLEIMTPDGRISRLERPVVAALVSELTVPVAEPAWPFMRETDILDFPGARAREIIREPEAFLATKGAPGRVFLRGKVAYLFQSYESNHEISALLLCIGDSVQNVPTIPNMIDNWVRSTLGETPEQRLDKRNALFVVLTKFDREFEEKQGEDPTSGARWTARINASLVDFFKTCSWIKEWTPGQPFNNVYWLRSTSISFPAVFDYSDDASPDHETGVSPRGERLIQQRLPVYLSNPEIRRYIHDPQTAWSEALKPNDGGISYLAQSLEPLCGQGLKAEQIRTQIAALKTELGRYIQPYYHTPDSEAAVKQAHKEAQDVARSLMRCVSMQMFGPLLHMLQVNREQMIDIWRIMESQPALQSAPIGRTSDTDDLFKTMFPDSEPGKKENPDPASPAAYDRHEHFADLVITKWNALINALSQDPSIERSFGVPPDHIALLTAELARLSRRLGLRDHLASLFRKNSSYQSSLTLGGETQALIAETEIGNFVTFWGYHNTPEQDRPEPLGLRGEHIFAPREAPEGELQLAEQPTPYAERFVRDWISAMVRRFEENAGAMDMNGLSPQANEALGLILHNLGEI